MKLFSLSVLYKGDPKAVLLSAAYDVSSFSFFQRTSVQEFMTFTSQLIVERSAKGNRASVKEQEYLCHVYVRNDSLAGVVIADSEYPSRVAFTLLEKAPPWHRFLPCARLVPQAAHSLRLPSLGRSPWVSCGCARACVTSSIPASPPPSYPCAPSPAWTQHHVFFGFLTRADYGRLEGTVVSCPQRTDTLRGT
ncbi:synaptobrevin homolog YKT6 isoform X2 [Pipistrellus kuhlii]|uniref:synaptobrevin homolog YKT6 isoform X2 n=1 Tax=Pipistrellus kuhlii TaxID=59472 RepID=UPI001E273230|nr:synaptobrevin homolog YKT6 isoform X2 [Pipistrellus kuhlii]